MTTKNISVAFVCLGNICRSPMAEAVFKNIVKENGLENRFSKIDSFGTASYHVGDKPDHRTADTCKKHGVPINHRGQQIKEQNFNEFDYIICMDEENLYNLNRIKPASSKAVVKLFGDWGSDPKYGRIVEDPYYGGSSGFEKCYNQCVHFSKEFLRKELDITL